MSFNMGKKDNSATVKAFISNFVSNEFFSDFIKIGLYPSQFSNVTISTSSNDIIDYFKKFLSDLNKTSRDLNIPNYNQITKLINLSYSVFTIRQNNSMIINYDNIYQHIPNLEIHIRNFVEQIRSTRIKEGDEFRSHTDKLINSIQAFYEVQSISSGLVLFDNFDEYATSNNVSVFEAIKNYKDIVIRLYNDLSKLQTVNKLDSEKDYFIISDKQSTLDLSKTIVQHLTTGYSFLKTGYELFDDNLQGVESSTVHLISAPSNHGKSLLMTNLCYQMIRENIHDFKENDAVLFVTLEDNIYKLSRRFCSIFGNIEQKTMTDLHLKTSDVANAEEYVTDDKQLQTKFVDIFQDVFNNSIQHVINNKLKLIVKHGPENQISAGDISKFIDTVNIMDGLNVKLIFIDYVDTMETTVKAMASDYDKHGIIVQELRNLSRQYKMPIVTATQNSKQSENTQYGLSNTQIGDSYKKIRYSDFVYMCRQRRDINAFDENVKRHCFSDDAIMDNDQINPAILKIKDQICENLIPMEIKITKSKDDGKDESTMWLFCKQNLRIYQNINDYIQDVPDLVNNTKNLQKEIDMISNNTIATVSTDFDLGDAIELDFDNDTLI